jgi:hypothetical protein
MHHVILYVHWYTVGSIFIFKIFLYMSSQTWAKGNYLSLKKTTGISRRFL